MERYEYKIIQVKFDNYVNGINDGIRELEAKVNKECLFVNWKPVGGITIINTTGKLDIMLQTLRRRIDYSVVDEVEEVGEEDWIDEVDDF